MWPAVVAHLASQIGVPPEAYFDGEWSERTQRHQRAQIRKHFGFRPFRARDESVLVGWLSQRVGSFNPEAEALKLAAYDHLRSQRIEPPAPERLRSADFGAGTGHVVAHGPMKHDGPQNFPEQHVSCPRLSATAFISRLGRSQLPGRNKVRSSERFAVDDAFQAFEQN